MAVLQMLLLVDNHQPFRPILLQPYDLGEDPLRLLFPIAPFDRPSPATLWVLHPPLSCHRIDAPPLPLPVEVPRALDLADPRLAPALNHTGQVDGQDPMIKGIVGLWEMPLGL
ncbi:MAG TPA: hypothetical protein VIH59_04495 [Candidatus Tectomicrobia bacterium]